MHFSTLVISNTNSYSEISDNLAPFQDNCNEDCPKQYLEFVDETEHLKHVWETKKISVWRGPNNEIIPHNCKTDIFYREPTQEEKQALENNDEEAKRKLKIDAWKLSKGVYSIFQEPKGYFEEEIPLKEYQSFEDYADYYTGGKDPETGLYGQWENPNGIWDFWEIGGRFHGIILKNDQTNATQTQIKDLKKILPVSDIINQKELIDLDESDDFTKIENWHTEIQKFLNKFSQDKWLTVIDCHR